MCVHAYGSQRPDRECLLLPSSTLFTVAKSELRDWAGLASHLAPRISGLCLRSTGITSRLPNPTQENKVNFYRREATQN